MLQAPEPHPLDYDWRYSAETVASICNLLPREGEVLAVGAPSVARYLQAEGREATLVDRQPFQGLPNHWPIDVGTTVNEQGRFEVAVVDPPWYPNDLRHWTAWTARLLTINGTLIVSLWPANTRPGDADEFAHLQDWMAQWADLEILPLIPHYERPPFEIAASTRSHGPLTHSPGFGRLLRLKIRRYPEIPSWDQPQELWQRFVLNDYQLALRLDAGSSLPVLIDQHPNAVGWIWPYVSKRAPGRETIGLWSSRNEVAAIKNPNQLSGALRRAFNAPDAACFEAELAEYPELRDWAIPRPPYWRLSEWHHPQ